jgi:hypothetical protein
MKVRNQRGLTLIGFLMVLAIGLFFSFIAMRVAPMYLEYQAVIGALKALQNDPASRSQSPAKLKQRIMNSLYVSYSHENVKTHHIKITRANGIRVRVAYEVRKPLFGNLDVIGAFDRAIVLR